MTVAAELGRDGTTCRLDDLPDGKVVELPFGRDGRARVCAVRYKDRVYAFNAVCPHRAGPMGFGTVRPAVSGSQPGTVTVEPDVPVVGCPWHHWEYRLDSGDAVVDGAGKMRTYEAIVEGDKVHIRSVAASKSGGPRR